MKTILTIIIVILLIALGVYAYKRTVDPVGPVGTNTTVGTSTNSAEGAPEGSLHNLPTPPAVSEARRQLAVALNVDLARVVVMSVEETEWPNGCLGLAKVGEGCTQALVPGYRITMESSGKTYVYRTNADGSSVRAE